MEIRHKVGDIVKCVTSRTDSLTVGKIYTVTYVDADLINVQPLSGERLHAQGFFHTRFTKV